MVSDHCPKILHLDFALSYLHLHFISCLNRSRENNIVSNDGILHNRISLDHHIVSDDAVLHEAFNDAVVSYGAVRDFSLHNRFFPYLDILVPDDLIRLKQIPRIADREPYLCLDRKDILFQGKEPQSLGQLNLAPWGFRAFLQAVKNLVIENVKCGIGNIRDILLRLLY